MLKQLEMTVFLNLMLSYFQCAKW